MTKWRSLSIAILFGVGLAGLWSASNRFGPIGQAAAQTDPSAESLAGILAQGKEVYVTKCASCHGAKLEGQPDWKRRLANGRMPAPPHDITGHTWHHSDQDLFRIVKEGVSAIVGNGYESDMLAFGPVLNDDQIRATMAYIESTWPDRQRAAQHALTVAAAAAMP